VPTLDTDARRRHRDPGFRERVLRAYEYRCCVYGFDLRIGRAPAGLEAAHIQWHHAGGRGMAGELQFHGRAIHPPQQAEQLPEPGFLAWNLKNVFKAPARPARRCASAAGEGAWH
jgi:putative restriction endonuclease